MKKEICIYYISFSIITSWPYQYGLQPIHKSDV